MRRNAVVACLSVISAFEFPEFSWDTLPVHWHGSNNTADYNDEQIRILAKYPLVTFDSKQGWEHNSWRDNATTYEADVVSVFRRIKAVNPKVTTIAYMNTHLAYPWYANARIYNEHPEWWVRLLNGTVVESHDEANGYPKTWNWCEPSVRGLWKESLFNLTRTGAVDGFFFDGGVKGMVGKNKSDLSVNDTEWMKWETNITSEVQAFTKGVCIIGSGGDTSPGCGGTQVQNFGKGNRFNGIRGINRTMYEGKLFEAHGGFVSRGKGDPYSPLVQTTVAAFLITAGKYAYYGNSGFTGDPPVWWPVYDMPLGSPLSNATMVNASAWTRNFSRGTRVQFDFATQRGTVDWAPTPAPPTPPPTPALMPISSVCSGSNCAPVYNHRNCSAVTIADGCASVWEPMGCKKGTAGWNNWVEFFGSAGGEMDTVAAAAAAAAAVVAAPVVYWKSSPVRPNETVLVAGAGLNGATTEWCHGSGMCDPASATVGESSVQAVLPSNCKAPCSLRMSTKYGKASIDINGPDVTWTRIIDNTGRLLRVFGRGLAWEADGTTCISAAQPHRLKSTVLSLAGVLLTTHGNASCYEASFMLPTSIPGGSNAVTASLSTTWGTATFSILVPPVAPVPKPPAVIDVDAEHAGNISAAVAAAAAVAAPQRAVIKLGAKTYSLTASLTVPNRTDFVGAGDSSSILDFSLPENIAPLPASSDSLYAATNAFAVGGGASDWSLRNLSVVLRRGPPRSAAVWLDGCGRHGTGEGTKLRLLGVTVRLLQDNVSNNAVVIEGCATPEGTGGGTDFEIGASTFVQEGACWVVNQQQKKSFNHSWGGNAKSVITTVGASGGWLHDSLVQWNCGGPISFVRSDRTIVENNIFNCTGGTPASNGTYVIEGAGAVSSWNFASRPSSKLWSIARNKFVRPVNNDKVDPTHRNWYQRESLTSDAPGEYGHGMLVAADGVRVRVAWNVTMYDKHASIAEGATLAVLGGGGLGQRRIVAGYDRTTDEVVLKTPLDAHATPMRSYVAVISSNHDYVVAGNTFEWGNVIQLFGNAYGGIMADNRLENCNHKLMNQAPTDTWDLGAMRVEGSHYHGASPVFFTEIVGNTLVNSDGIVLGNHKPPLAPGEACSNADGNDDGDEKCVAYLRWAVVRRNTISGVSAAALNLSATQPPCGYVSTNGPRQPFATDVVAEHNAFVCPRPGFLPHNGTYLPFCSNCTAR